MSNFRILLWHQLVPNQTKFRWRDSQFLKDPRNCLLNTLQQQRRKVIHCTLVLLRAWVQKIGLEFILHLSKTRLSIQDWQHQNASIIADVYLVPVIIRIQILDRLMWRILSSQIMNPRVWALKDARSKQKRLRLINMYLSKSSPKLQALCTTPPVERRKEARMTKPMVDWTKFFQ